MLRNNKKGLLQSGY